MWISQQEYRTMRRMVSYFNTFHTNVSNEGISEKAKDMNDKNATRLGRITNVTLIVSMKSPNLTTYRASHNLDLDLMTSLLPIGIDNFILIE